MNVFAVNDFTTYVDNAQAEKQSGIFASPAILSRLRLETRAEHEAVEQVLDLMAASLTLDDYRQRLEQFYGFYALAEIALLTLSKQQANRAGTPTTSVNTYSAIASRSTKTALLASDIHHLGGSTKHLPLCHDLPPLHSEADVLGCMYVMEGATLGGRLITQHVQKTLGITPTTGGSFFEGYGEHTGKMWQIMRQLLVSGAYDIDTENAIVANAITTFACLRRWCELCQTRQQHTNFEVAYRA
jgi:heme oxygenase (biliverdin-IX-beta and delta-forming)